MNNGKLNSLMSDIFAKTGKWCEKRVYEDGIERQCILEKYKGL